MFRPIAACAICVLSLPPGGRADSPPVPSKGPEQIKTAISKALPLLLKGAEGHVSQRTCFACHNQGIPLLAMTTARERGFPVHEKDLKKQLDFIAAFLEKSRNNYRKGEGQGGQVDTAGYALFSLELGGWKPDATTDAVAEYLLLRNKDLDHWRTTSNRPPSEVSDFTATYLAIRALRRWGTPEQKERIASRIDAARGWLLKTPAKDIEDRVFRLWALRAAAAEDKDVRSAVHDLVRSQRKDGGWGQTDAMESDAYATGTALVVLHQAGNLATTDLVYQRGVAFLLAKQQEDGSWLVRSRSKPFQAYYESGFPHGKDQFISMAASGWATTALALTRAPTVKADDWPQWRGPARDGVWEGTGLPDKLPGDLKPRWKQPLGGGYGGIVVVGGRVFVMDRQKEPKEVERALCLDATSGKTLWTHEYEVTYGKLDYGNGPRSTPTVYQGRVYTFGALGQLYCLDSSNGKVIWSHDTVKAFKSRIPTWGHACSPLVDGNRVVVQVGGEPNACLMAFDCVTGKEVWRSLPDRPGYASPMLIETKQERLLVYWTPEHIVGLEPETGKVRWRVPFPITYDVSISDLVWHDGILLASNYWTGSKALRLDDKGDKPEVVWEGKALSLLMSTPLVKGGHVYALDRNRGLKCIEMKTGAVKWEGEHVTPRGQNPQASLVWAGDRALILNERGELLLAELTPEAYRGRGKAAILDGLIWAHPAFADNCVFVRNDEAIVCVPLVVK
jgi:outer membrane protein assembly factor BamB